MTPAHVATGSLLQRFQCSREPASSLRLTELFELGICIHQNVPNVLNSPGVQLAKRDFQQHPVKGWDQVHVLQAIRERLPYRERV